LEKKLCALEQEIDAAGLKAGNAQTFEALFKQWYEPLCRYAHSILHNTDEAEDTVQKIFCKLWEQREKMEIQTSIKSYLYKMVHNLCLNKIRQMQIQSEHQQQIACRSLPLADSVEQRLTYKELSRQASLAIEALPQRCREVFLLSRMQHLSYVQIAQRMQISPNTVEVQMVKALKVLRMKLKDYLNG
jgi:RNA polymerase sigma-70 factor (ECF subfamily)